MLKLWWKPNRGVCSEQHADLFAARALPGQTRPPGSAMRLVIATTAHTAGDVRVRFKIVDSLVRRGVDVTWVGPRSYGGAIPMADLPEGVSFRWLPAVRGFADRVVTPLRLRRALRRDREAADWVYCPDPDALLGVGPLRRRGARVWFDIHERFHNDHAGRWLGPLDCRTSREAVRRAIAFGAARAELVTSPSPSVLADYAPAHPNAHLLLNAAPDGFAANQEPATRSPRDPMLVMHGRPGPDRGTAELGRALDLLEHLGCQVRVLCLGTPDDLAAAIGAQHAARLADPARLARFDLIAPVSFSQMAALTARCHAGAVGYTGSLAEASLPNRLFEYLALGLPVLGPVESPHIAAVIEQHDCGLTYRNAEPETLARVIERLYHAPDRAAAMGAQGKAAFHRQFSWESQVDAILARLGDRPARRSGAARRSGQRTEG